MEISEYENIYKNESNHFYYVGLHKLVESLIKKYSFVKNPTILDAGCGTGLLLKKLSKVGLTTGIDLSPEAIRFAKKRKINVNLGSVTKIPFKGNTFDIVTSMDVINLSEVKSDKQALYEIYKVLKPGGILILRASAIPWLSSGHDKWVHIKKRYTKIEMRNLIQKSGFEIQKLSYINFFLFLPAFAKHIAWRISGTSNHSSSIDKVPTLINKIMILCMKLEEYLLKYVDMPIGNGLIVVARKPRP